MIFLPTLDIREENGSPFNANGEYENLQKRNTCKYAVKFSIAVSLLVEGENLKQESTDFILPVLLWITD